MIFYAISIMHNAQQTKRNQQQNVSRETKQKQQNVETRESQFSKQPLSTISYNTDEFLKLRLERLKAKDMISHYMYIHHKGETDPDDPDEIPEKDHIHLIVFPLKSLDMIALRKKFEEPDPTNDKPLGVRPFHITKENRVVDWELYAIHDPRYLRGKGLKRDYHYSHKDIITDDVDFLGRLIRDIKGRISDLELLLDYVEQGATWDEVARDLFITIRELKRFKETYIDIQNEFGNHKHIIPEAEPLDCYDPYHAESIKYQSELEISCEHLKDQLEYFKRLYEQQATLSRNLQITLDTVLKKKG